MGPPKPILIIKAPMLTLNLGAGIRVWSVSQRAQYPLIKEYSFKTQYEASNDLRSIP